MKEGLRSWGFTVNDEKKGDEEKQESCNKGGEKILHLDLGDPGPVGESLGMEIEKQGDGLGEHFGEDGDKGRRNDGPTENERNKKMVDSGEKITNIDTENKKVDAEMLTGKERIIGRVLRSRFVVKGGTGSNNTEDEGVAVEKSGGVDGSEMKCVEVEEEMSHQLVEAPEKKPKGKRGRPPKLGKIENGLSAGGLKKKKKLKRGRPRKVDNNVINALDNELMKQSKVKRGRPRKVQESDSVDVGLRKKLKLKRGRPPKVQDGDGSDGLGKKLNLKRGRPPKVQENDASDGRLRKKLKRKCERAVNMQESDAFDGGLKKKLKVERGMPPTVQVSKGKLGIKSKINLKLHGKVKQNTAADRLRGQRVLIADESNVRFSSPTKNKDGIDFVTRDNKASLENRSKATINAKKGMDIREEKNTEKVGEIKPPSARQSVRDKIIDILQDAGWTIEYRPRFGRDYKDAVYVNPEGKTHWSVTLAYEKLKMHYENGDSNVYKTGFKFSPLPEQELNVLKKVIVKERDDKGKSRKEGKCEENIGVIGNKKQKKKLNGKSLKGRAKEKETMHKRMPRLVRGHNQHKTQGKKRCALLARNSMEGGDSDADGYVTYDGKRTVLAWMIDLGTVSLDGKVHYMNRRKTRVLLEGRITRDGIYCDCCNEIITISKFETHAGSKLCEPYKNIFLESGISLLQCLLDSWNKQQESERKAFYFIDVNGEDPNDDTCGICGDGGDLICCDGCPSTFHQSCLDIKKFPSGDWHCVYCSCKFCWMVCGNTCQKDDDNYLATSALLTCHLCQEKYHQFCTQANDAVYDDSCGPSFCGKKCQELFKKLQIVLGVKHEMEEGFSWTLVRRSDVGSCKSLLDTTQMVECNSNIIESNSKLAVALYIMNECFLPIVDHRSGINLIHNIVYNCGSNFNRLNYSGFFTAILERDDEIVCAASIRIHGNQLAEMPFIGTRHMYRRQGMCRRLLSAIEYVLCSLDVERLVIPAISELRETWTSIFGFKPLEASSKKKMKNKNMLVFPGVDILQKPLMKLPIVEENVIIGEGSTSTKKGKSLKGVLCNANETCIGGFDLNVSSEATFLPAVDSNLQLPDGPSNGTSDLTSETMNLTYSATDPNSLGQIDVAEDNSDAKEKSNMNPLGSADVLHEQTELIGEYQYVSGSTIPFLDGKKVEFDRRPNLRGASEEESKSFMLPLIKSEATYCGRPVFCASRESMESANYEGKAEDSSAKNNFTSHNEGSVNRSTKINTAEPQEKAPLLELDTSGENAICHDSEAKSQVLTDNRNLKCHNSEHCSEDKKIDIHRVEYSQLHTQGGFPQILPICSNLLPEVIRQSSLTENSEGCHSSLPAEFCNSAFQGNGIDTCEVGMSALVDTEYYPSCGAHLETNGVSKAKGVNSSSLVVSVHGVQDPKEVRTMALGDIPTDMNDRPNLNAKSLKKSDFDSQVDHASAVQCNPETLCNAGNTSGVALHCASGGGGSCGAPEVMILSNQAS